MPETYFNLCPSIKNVQVILGTKLTPRRKPMPGLILASSHKHVYIIIHLAAKINCSFPACMETRQWGSRAFDLVPGIERNMNHTSMPCLITYTCVDMPASARAYRRTHAHSRMQVFYAHLENIPTACTHTVHELSSTYSQSEMETHGTAAGEECVLLLLTKTFLPLDLPVGVPLNCAYIPSVHPALLCALLCSPALNFCQGIH